MNEKLIEKKLREGVKLRGGVALKLISPCLVGMPDRIVLMPNGKALFVELKTTGKKPTAIQQSRIEALKTLGFVAVVIDSQEGLTNFLNEL